MSGVWWVWWVGGWVGWAATGSDATIHPTLGLHCCRRSSLTPPHRTFPAPIGSVVRLFLNICSKPCRNNVRWRCYVLGQQWGC